MALDATKFQGMKINEEKLRDRFVTNHRIDRDPAIQETTKKWLKETPTHVRAGAIRDLKKAYQNEFDKCKADSSHHFKMKFRSKKRATSIELETSAFKKSKDQDPESTFRLYQKILKDPIGYDAKTTTKLGIDLATHDRYMRMSMTKLGRFYLHIPYTKPMKATFGGVPHEGEGAAESQGKEDGNGLKSQTGHSSMTNPRMASVDPGVSPFLCVWSPTSHECYQVGMKDKFKLEKWILKADRVLTMAQHFPIKNIRRKYYKAYWRLREKIWNRVKDMHEKTAIWLCSNFDVIFYSKFQISSMVNKELKRKINKRTSRNLYSWNFYKFRKTLEHKAEELGKKVHLVDEHYTSKTCTSCGFVKYNLSGKVYRCDSCKSVIDRDVVGARNIFLKNVHLL